MLIAVIVVLFLMVGGLAYYCLRLNERILVIEDERKTLIGFNDKVSQAVEIASMAAKKADKAEAAIAEAGTRVVKVERAQKEVIEADERLTKQRAKRRDIKVPMAQGW